MTKEEKLKIFQDMVLEKNKVMNLTAITDPQEFEIKHIRDSIAPLPLFNFKSGDLIADLGTGAGFPGIPLAIMREDVEFHLFDSLKKRLNFIDECVKILEIKNVKTFHGRFEDFAHQKEIRGKYDALVSRATAPLPVLIEYIAGFIKVDGYAFCYKGQQVHEEIEESKRALGQLRMEIDSIQEYSLEELKHNILKIHKKEKTPKQFPRKAGTPSKKPL